MAFPSYNLAMIEVDVVMSDHMTGGFVNFGVSHCGLMSVAKEFRNVDRDRGNVLRQRGSR